MVAHRRILDGVIRHRHELERYRRGEASAILSLLEREDAKLIETLRRRLPHIRSRDIRGARLLALMKAMREMRGTAIRTVRSQLRDDLAGLAAVEGDAVGRIITSALPVRVTFNPIRAATLRAIVTQQPFAGGTNATRTLHQWFTSIAQGDQQRLVGAIQLGVRRQETVSQMVTRIAGTRRLKFADGVLAITRRQAETAVRTAVNHVANAAQRAYGEANADVVIGWQWVSMLDDRLCEICFGNDGGFVPNGDNPAPDGMRELGDVSPPVHPNDRCALVPIIDASRLAAKVPDRIETVRLAA